MRALIRTDRLVSGLAGVGILLVLASQFLLAFVAFGAAACWWLMGRLRRASLPTKQPEPGASVAQAVSSPGPASDGWQGAFARLDPAWRRWLNGEGER